MKIIHPNEALWQPFCLGKIMIQSSKTGRCLSFACLIGLTLSSAVLEGQTTPLGLQQVTLGWSANPDPAVAGYFLYYGTASGVYTNKTDAGTNTWLSVSGLVAGSTYFFTATSYTAAGTESTYGPEVSYVVPGILTVGQDPSGDIMRIQFPVAPTHSYQLQFSLNLMNWSNLWLTPTQATNGWLEYDDPCTNTIPSRFYRLILN
jgi:hypothetical protein